VSGQLHAPAAIPPGNEHQYPLARRMGGPRDGLDAVARGKISSPNGESNPGRPDGSLVTILTELQRHIRGAINLKETLVLKVHGCTTGCQTPHLRIYPLSSMTKREHW
jgi:hypothetical protein